VPGFLDSDSDSNRPVLTAHGPGLMIDRPATTDHGPVKMLRGKFEKVRGRRGGAALTAFKSI